MGRATYFLILASVAASAYSWTYNLDLSFSLQKLLAENYASLVTALFAHASITHLAGNMLFLLVFGNFVESHLGGIKVLTAFFAGGILSFLLSIPFYTDSPMIGASAAIFTLAAISMLIRPLNFLIVFFVPVGVAALAFFIFNVIAITQGVVSNTGYVAHVIGFLIGVAIGARWIDSWKENLVKTVIALIIYVVLINAIIRYISG